MSRRIPASNAGRLSIDSSGGANIAGENPLARQQLARRTQWRILARRRQNTRLHDQALIHNAQHAIPHITRTEARQARRQQLLAQLTRHMPHNDSIRTQHPLAFAHHRPAHPARQPDESSPDTWRSQPIGVTEREAGGHGGSSEQEPDTQSQRERRDEDVNGASMSVRRGSRGIRATGQAFTQARRAIARNESALQQFLSTHHRDALMCQSLMVQAWTETLLKAVNDAMPSRGATDAALACQDDLLAAWQRHGDSVDFNQGALLAQFLPTLRTHVAPVTDVNKPYALLPLMLISGFRYRSPTQLRDARTRIGNQRLARLAPIAR